MKILTSILIMKIMISFISTSVTLGNEDKEFSTDKGKLSHPHERSLYQTAWVPQ